MKLILTEIPKNYRDKRFPPIFKMSYEVPPINGQSNQLNQSLNQNSEEEKDIFNFNSIVGSSPYFWYPPLQNLKSHHEKMEKIAKTKLHNSLHTVNSNSTKERLQKKVVYVAP